MFLSVTLLKYPGSRSDSIEQARSWVKRHRKCGRGCQCPACDQRAVETERHLSAAMCRVLVVLYFRFSEPHDEEWVHVLNYLRHLAVPTELLVCAYAKLELWGFIARQNYGTPRAGHFRITNAGRWFVEGRRGYARVPYAYILYRNKVVRTPASTVSIREVFAAADVDFDALMAQRGLDPLPLRSTR